MAKYCPVAPCLDIFPLKLNLNILKSDLDAVENQLHASMQVCKYEAIQVYKYAIKSESYALIFSQSGLFVIL